jgi:hypothetical protein
MKTIPSYALTALAALTITACDVKVDNTDPPKTTVVTPGEKKTETNTTIVNPPKEEKKVENNTTIVNPPKEEKKVETNTTIVNPPKNEP